MKLKQWGVTGIVLLAMSVWVTGPVVAGNLDSPGAPESTMYTLEQIYERLEAMETRIGEGEDAAADHGVGTADSEPATGPAPTMHTLTEIYSRIHAIDGAIDGLIGDGNGGDGSWTAPAPVPQTGVDASYCGDTGERDDCDLQKGVEWPDPRFTVNNNGTVTDNLTGLVWLHDARCSDLHPANNAIAWYQAMESVLWLSAEETASYHYTCGLTDGSEPGDWRMPNALELMSLYNFGPHRPEGDVTDLHLLRLPLGHPFRPADGGGTPSTDRYWTSTPRHTALGVDGMFTFRFHVSHYPIAEYRDHKNPDHKHFLWPVRDLRPDELPGGGDDD